MCYRVNLHDLRNGLVILVLKRPQTPRNFRPLLYSDFGLHSADASLSSI